MISTNNFENFSLNAAAEELNDAYKNFCVKAGLENSRQATFLKRLWVGEGQELDDVKIVSYKSHFNNALKGKGVIPHTWNKKFEGLAQLNADGKRLLIAVNAYNRVFNANKQLRMNELGKIQSKTFLLNVATLCDDGQEFYKNETTDELFKFPTVACILSFFRYALRSGKSEEINEMMPYMVAAVGDCFNPKSIGKNTSSIFITSGNVDSIYTAIAADQKFHQILYRYFDKIVFWYSGKPYPTFNLKDSFLQINLRDRGLNSSDFTVCIR